MRINSFYVRIADSVHLKKRLFLCKSYFFILYTDFSQFTAWPDSNIDGRINVHRRLTRPDREYLHK